MGKNTKNKNMFRKNNERNFKKKGQEGHSINLFCFDVFSYKESTRKIQKININLLRI